MQARCAPWLGVALTCLACSKAPPPGPTGRPAASAGTAPASAPASAEAPVELPPPPFADVPPVGPAMASPARPQPDVALSVNKKKLAIMSGLVWAQGGSGVTVYLSTDRVGCAMLYEGPDMKGGQTSLQFTATPTLLPDGTRKWSARTLGLTQEKKKGQASVDPLNGATSDITVEKIDLHPGGLTTMTVDIKAPLSPPLAPKGTFEAKGKLELASCGRMTMRMSGEPAPPAAVPQAVKLALAREAVPLRGAKVYPSDLGMKVALSSEPMSCAALSGSGGDVKVDLTFDASGKVTHLHVGGDLVAQQGHEANWEPPESPFAVKLEGPVEGKGSVGAALSGSGVVDSMPVSLGGKATLLRCPKAPF
jgi:hypothetical protein